MNQAFDPSSNPLLPSASTLDEQLNDIERQRTNGDFEGALQRIDRIARAHPRNPRALNEKGVCLRLCGRPVEAALELRKARKLLPDSPEILANLANCLRDERDFESAIRAYRRALELRPDFAPVLAELGEVHHALGDLNAAIAAYERSLELHPQNPVTLANHASACVESGDAEHALQSADWALKFDAHERRAMAVKSIALHELGRAAEANELSNLDWVRAFPIEAAPGFGSLSEFNRALTEHVSTHATLEFEPSDRTTVRGEQTGELFDGSASPVAALQHLITERVEAFLDDLPSDPDHPYLGIRPPRLRWNIWGTRLGDAGHQAPHFHPAGWVSGVYYVQLPPEMTASESNQEGWIEFGGAPAGWKLEKELPTRRFAPAEGTLFLFPSYLYHRTLPFHSETKRISIAFDAIPY